MYAHSKQIVLEITEQLGWQSPDAIVYPAGGGVGIIGIWRAFVQLVSLGWIQEPLPRLIVTQAEGCAPLVKAFAEGKDVSVAAAYNLAPCSMVVFRAEVPKDPETNISH